MCDVKYQGKRKKCGWCRFQKCVAVGMKASCVKDPLADVTTNNVSQLQSDYYGKHENNVYHTLDDEDTELKEPRKKVSRTRSSDPCENLVQHEFLFVMKSGRQDVIDARVVDISLIPLVSNQVTVEVPIEEVIPENYLTTAVSGLTFLETPSQLVFENDYGRVSDIKSCVIQMKREGKHVVIRNMSHDTMTMIHSLTDGAWSRLCLAAKMSKSFREIKAVQYTTLTSVGEDIFPRNGYKFVSINLRVPDFETRIKAAFESADPFFSSLSAIDQMILLKEGAPELGFIRSWLTYDKDTESMRKPCFNHRLVIGMKIKAFGSLYDSVRSLLHEDWIDDRIRQDNLVMNLVFFLCFYQDRQGLFQKAGVIAERQIYCDILDKYIASKVNNVEWKGTKDQIWDMINHKITLASMLKVPYSNVAPGGSWKSNELVPWSYSPPVTSSILYPRKQILWVKELWSSPMPQELLKFRVLDTYFQACDSFKITLSISLDPASDADHQFLQSLIIPSFKRNEPVTSDSDSTSISLQTTNGLVTFYRETSSMFNLHVSTMSKKESSIIIMESLNDQHWARLKDIISFARILYRFTYADHEVTTNRYPLEPMVHDLNQPVYNCILNTSVEMVCDIISKAIESLSFFSKLSIEDQFIILKDSFFPVDCLLFNHTYDDEAESYVFTALDGQLSHCRHKDRLKIYSLNQYSEKLDQFYNSFLDKFFVFLRTDFLFISILSIVCVLQENPGLSCTDLLKIERKHYCEILDAYIRAKVISNEWLSDVDIIWRNIDEIFYELSKYPIIVKQFVKEQQKIKSNF